jgi:hypothetical protein
VATKPPLACSPCTSRRGSRLDVHKWALTGETPMLIRNYDYRPELCERVVYSSALTGRRVIGSSDCLWGLLDGMNDGGLAISLAFGGRRGAASGFGIPLVVRYVLEVADTVPDAIAVLARVPVNMAYNLTILDRNADTRVCLSHPEPSQKSLSAALPPTTVARSPMIPDHAQRFRSVERQRRLLALQDRSSGPKDCDRRVPRATALQHGVRARFRHYVHGGIPPQRRNRRLTSGQAPSGGADSTRRTRHMRRPINPVWGRWSLDHRVVISAPLALCGIRMILARATPRELADLAERSIDLLAQSEDPAAFGYLLQLTRLVGESLGLAARTLAHESSWSQVATNRGNEPTGRLERWSSH